jgi:hypothetical protein
MSEQAYDALLVEHEVAMLQERIAELELATEDAGWQRLDDSGTDLDMTPQTLRRIIRDAQTMSLANPLIDHAVSTTAHYVFGQGVSIAGQGVANDRVQAFLADRGNRRTLTSQQSLIANDRQLTYEGNVFLACFSPPGEVTRVRRIPTFQVLAGDIIRNPEDDADVWLYKRRWVRVTRDPATGARKTEERIDYYPDMYHRPDDRPDRWRDGDDEGEVHWDAPVVHIRDGGLTGAKFGVPTVFSSLAWARAVSRDLSDYATVRRALARFAWKVSTKSRAGARAVRDKLQSTVTADAPVERNPAPVTGSAFIATDGNSIEPIRTAGAAPNPEEGRRLWLMVSAGTGIPETILSGNADAGNLATAKTLDRPTELMMSARQSVWQDALADIIEYDLTRASDEGLIPTQEVDPDAPSVTDPVTGLTVAAMRDVDLTPSVEFPDILEDDVTARVGAIVSAATLGASGTTAGTMPDDLLTRLLLTALGVDDVDAIVADMFPPEAPDEPGEPEMPGMDDGMDIAPEPDLLTDVPMESTFREALDAFTTRLVAGRHGPRPHGPVRRGRTRRAQTPPPAG